MKEIWIATQNTHKLKEFEEMLHPLGYTVKSLLDLKTPIEIEETGETFEENATIKAKALYDVLHQEVISDDSGICINHFDGKPGVYSARWLGEKTSYDFKNNYIIENMEEAKDRGAQYVCSICHVDANGKANVYTGKCVGEITYEPVGEKGFGYDPIFYYPPFETTLANVEEKEKNAISHRAKALALLMKGMK